MPHLLPELPYPYNALEPYCDEVTVKLHHDIHHKAYVDGLSKHLAIIIPSNQENLKGEMILK